MMTEKERRAALNDESNFFYTRRFPYRDGDPIRVTEFEFYGLKIYRLDMYQMCFDSGWWLSWDLAEECKYPYAPGWKKTFLFTDDKEGTVRIINYTEAIDLMKEAEKREKEGAKNEQVEENADPSK